MLFALEPSAAVSESPKALTTLMSLGRRRWTEVEVVFGVKKSSPHCQKLRPLKGVYLK